MSWADICNSRPTHRGSNDRFRENSNKICSETGHHSDADLHGSTICFARSAGLRRIDA